MVLQIIAPHHRIPVSLDAISVDAMELFLAYPITFRHHFLLARLMVKHHRPTRTQLLNTPGYHYKLAIRSYACRSLVARRHDELVSPMAKQRRMLLMRLAIFLRDLWRKVPTLEWLRRRWQKIF